MATTVNPISLVDSELEVLEKGAETLARSQLRWATAWRAIENWLGLPVALLSAVAGVLILASENYQGVAAIFAFVGSALGSLLSFLAPDGRSHKAQTLAVISGDFGRRVRQSRRIDLSGASDDEARKMLSNFTEEWREVMAADVDNQLDRILGRIERR